MESNPETKENTTQEVNKTQKANESLPNKNEPSTDLKKLITKIDNRIKTKDVTDTKGHNFEDYELKIELLKGIYEKGFEKPSNNLMYFISVYFIFIYHLYNRGFLTYPEDRIKSGLLMTN